MTDKTANHEQPASNREGDSGSSCNDLLSVFADEMSDYLGEWMAEGEQYSQQAQNDKPYWDHLHDKIMEYLERAHDVGWYAAAGKAIGVCNARAELRDDWGTPRSNEAAKCALQIEHELVTATEKEPDDAV